ncbi:MAG TPA: prepilin-type N-terminal cleavage/methylation domain-containing protein, partial [Gemmatimonadales bacterium]|nr:prepilin-type N-terminal cleavage/methylation domain-containing protein [Gemmatimonadales bacterium]
MTSRRGFTLVELLVALVLLATVLGATYQLLVNTQRVSRAQSEHVDMQSNMRSGALILASELRAVGFDTVPGAATVSPDILDNQATSVRFRAIRSSGLICAYGSNYFVVDTVRDYAAYRQPTTNDRVMVFADRDTTLSSDDMWVRGRTITSFAAATCPNNTTWNSHAGLRFNVNTFPAPGATTPDSFT